MKPHLFRYIVSGFIFAGSATSSHAATLFFSASNTNPGDVSPLFTSPSNPTITLTSIGQAKTLYVWAQVNMNEAIYALSYNVVSSNGTTVTGVSSTLYNPTEYLGEPTYWRWASASGGAIASTGSTALLTNANGSFSTLNHYIGIDGYDGVPGGDNSFPINGTVVSARPNSDGSGYALVSDILIGQLIVSAASQGSVNLFFQTGSTTTKFEPLLGGPDINYGGGDAPVSASTPGSQSTLPDATIIVSLPEPSTIMASCLLVPIAISSIQRKHHSSKF